MFLYELADIQRLYVDAIFTCVPFALSFQFPFGANRLTTQKDVERDPRKAAQAESPGCHSTNRPGILPPQQTKCELKVAFEESRVRKINRFLPVGSMTVDSRFGAKLAIRFEILSSYQQASKQLH